MNQFAVTMRPKRLVQAIIRGGHRVLLNKGLPDQIGIYFHALSSEEHGDLITVISHFLRLGYRCVPPREFVDGNGKRLFISFDDNYRSWHDLIPVLEQLAVSATFYTNSGVFSDTSSQNIQAEYFNRLNYHGERITLSTTQLVDLASAGHSIGAHTHLHYDLGSIPFKQAADEILRSKSVLEEITGQSVVDFSFPFGMRRNFSTELRQFCLANGFETVADATPGMQHAGQSKSQIHRSVWHFEKPFDYNLMNTMIDGSWFERVTGRSGVG